MTTRDFERVRCPGCHRLVAAYVPIGGDGAGLQVLPHNRRATRASACPVSDRIVVLDGLGGWRVDGR